MNWKQENPRNRYIDDISWEEAKKIAYIASGMPSEFKLLSIEVKPNGNNIPHVELHYTYYEPVLCMGCQTHVGIFHNLNTYLGKGFNMVYCQAELFKMYETLGFYDNENK